MLHGHGTVVGRRQLPRIGCLRDGPSRGKRGDAPASGRRRCRGGAPRERSGEPVQRASRGRPKRRRDRAANAGGLADQAVSAAPRGPLWRRCRNPGKGTRTGRAALPSTRAGRRTSHNDRWHVGYTITVNFGNQDPVHYHSVGVLTKAAATRQSSEEATPVFDGVITSRRHVDGGVLSARQRNREHHVHRLGNGRAHARMSRPGQCGHADVDRVRGRRVGRLQTAGL